MTRLRECQNIAIIDAVGRMSSIPKVVPYIQELRGGGGTLDQPPCPLVQKSCAKTGAHSENNVIGDAAPLDLARLASWGPFFHGSSSAQEAVEPRFRPVLAMGDAPDQESNWLSKLQRSQREVRIADTII